MIISHKYKFIYLRTEKTASSSLSAALASMIAEDDFKASLERPPWAKYSPIHHGALKRQLPQLFGLHVHARASHVQQILGRERFNSYFKFCVERNPWDRQVSLYFQRKNKTGCADDADFDRDMRSIAYRSTEYVRLNNWSIYAIGNDVVADEVIRYENLEAGLEKVRRHIGLPGAIELPQLRSGFRDDNQDYRKHYSDVTQEMIASWYRREINALGYEF